MIPVSQLDASMLYAETPEMPMHMVGLLILEPLDVIEVEQLLECDPFFVFPGLGERRKTRTE